MTDITLINQLKSNLPKLNSGGAAGVASGFGEAISRTLKEADKAQKIADNAALAVQRGDSDNLHETIISMEQADIHMRLIVQIRNRAVEAYQEVMRMQV